MRFDVLGSERLQLRIAQADRFRFGLRTRDVPAVPQRALDHPQAADPVRRAAVDEDRLVTRVGNRREKAVHDLRIGRRRVEGEVDVLQSRSLSRGAVDSRDMIYFLSIIVLFLFITRKKLLNR